MNIALTRPVRQGLEKKWQLFTIAVCVGLAVGVLVSFKPIVGVVLPLLGLFCLAIIPQPKLGLYLIAAWLPFESLAGFGSDFSATKLLAIVTFLAWSVRLYKTKSSHINLNETAHLFLLALLAVATASLIGSKEFGVGVSRLATLIMLIMLYFVIIDLIDDQKSLKIIVLTLLFSSAIAAILPIVQVILNRTDQPFGAYLDPNFSALGLVILIPLAFVFLRPPTLRNNIVFWPTLLVILGGAMVTRSRGAAVALIVMLVLLSGEKLLDKRVRRMVVVILLILAVSIAGLALFFDQRFTLANITVNHAAGRFDIWATGLMIFRENYLFGIGLANYKFAYARYSTLIPWIIPRFREPLVAHNVFIEIAVETGIFGLLALLGFFGSALYKSRQLRRRHIAAGNRQQAVICSMFTISTIGLIVVCLALSALYLKIIWLILALANCQAMRTNESIAPNCPGAILDIRPD